MTGLTAQRQLAHHDDEAAANSQNQINQKERKAAGRTHLIGEAPDIAQADRRTNSSHQETKIGSKAFSFFHCFLSLLKNVVFLSIDRKHPATPPRCRNEPGMDDISSI